MKTLFLSPLQPQNVGGGGGGGGRGVIPASFPSRSPPPKQPFQPIPTPSPGSRQEVCEKIVIEVWVVFVRRPQAPGGPGPKPWGPGPKPPGDLAHRLLGPGSRHHNPQSADLRGAPKGGAVQFHERRFPSSLQHFSRWAGPQVSGDLANKPLNPASRSRIPKMPRCSSAHEKPGLLHRLISCAQSLQPSLTFLLRRNNKVQGARSLIA